MSATTIIDTAPLGALICYTDGSPKPPARFTKKLAAWERSNGVGRLVKKEPPRVYPTWTAPASFTLHEGNFSSDGVILVTIMRSHSVDSRLIFEVAEVPKAGQVMSQRCDRLDHRVVPLAPLKPADREEHRTRAWAQAGAGMWLDVWPEPRRIDAWINHADTAGADS